MKVTVKDPKSGDNKIPIHIHIGPNDFDMEAAVEGTGHPPEVGTYGPLKKSSGAKNQEAHHVPPKGLMNWLVEQARKSLAELNASPHKNNPEYAWIRQLAKVAKDVYDPGDPLAAISVHKETHIKTSGTSADAWRIHFGSETAKAVLKRLRGKKIAVQVGTVTYLLDFAFTELSAALDDAKTKWGAGLEKLQGSARRGGARCRGPGPGGGGVRARELEEGRNQGATIRRARGAEWSFEVDVGGGWGHREVEVAMMVRETGNYPKESDHGPS